MKKFYILLAVLAPICAITAQSLSGSYIVGSTQPFPFNTLTNAVQRINTSGVSGPVTFLLDNAVYNNASGESFPIKILSVSGSSESNTLTIRPNVGKTVTITANDVNSFTGVPAALQIDGGDNIIIDGSNVANGTARNLTIQNNNTPNYLARGVVWISSASANGVTNVHIRNTAIQMGTRNGDGQLLTGLFIGGNVLAPNNALEGSAATGIHSNITVTNNIFTNVRQGIYARGNATAGLESNMINVAGNNFGSTIDAQKPGSAIHFSDIQNFNIIDNNIAGLRNAGNGNIWTCAIQVDNGAHYNVKRNQISAHSMPVNSPIQRVMYFKGSHLNGLISENTITDVKNTGGGPVRGIDIELTPAVEASITIANNMISDISSTGTNVPVAGIYLASGQSVKMYHNTIHLNSALPSHSAGILIAGGTGLDIRNNILSNASTAGLRYSIYSAVAASSFSAINYNNYYSSQYVGYLGSNRTTLANWQTATSADQNSVSILPVYTSASNLRLTSANTTLDNRGTPLTSINNDIDNAVRNVIKPDLGADEFGPGTCATTTTWNGTAWSNGLPDGTKAVVFNGNFAISSPINACSIQIGNSATVTLLD